MTPIVSFGAEYMNNRPRYVDFASPEVLTLEELGLDQNETEAVVTEDDSSETAAMDPSDETNTAETPEVEESNEAEAGPEETDVEETSPTEKESGTEETGTEETGKSDSGPEGTKEESSTSLPEESEKIDKLQEEQEEAREPELYYDYDQYINEPEGQLVQFNESYRTYRTGEGQYVTVAGGYSGR